MNLLRVAAVLCGLLQVREPWLNTVVDTHHVCLAVIPTDGAPGCAQTREQHFLTTCGCVRVQVASADQEGDTPSFYVLGDCKQPAEADLKHVADESIVIVRSRVTSPMSELYAAQECCAEGNSCAGNLFIDGGEGTGEAGRDVASIFRIWVDSDIAKEDASSGGGECRCELCTVCCSCSVSKLQYIEGSS